MPGASGLSGATCVLCPAPAAVFCRNDGVLLCADCDVHTHSSSDYLSRHERVPLPYLPPSDRARVIGGDCVGMLSIPVTSEGLSHAPAAAAARQMPPTTAPVQHTAGQHNAQTSLMRNKSFLVSGRAAHPQSSSPFSFLSKLQPPPTLPALPLQHQHQLQHQRQQLLAATSMQHAGSSAGSDDTLWHELPPAQAARLYEGNLDATLRDCLEAFTGEHQLDLRLEPEAATCGVAHMAGGSQACDNGPSALLSTSSACDGLYRQHSAADDLFDSVRHQLYSAAVAAKAAAAEHRSIGAGRPTTGLPHANPFAAQQLAMAGRQAGTAVSSPAGDSFEQELRQAADRLMLQQQQQHQALLRHQDLERQQRQQQQQQQMELLRLRHLQQLCHQQQQMQQHSPSHALQQQQAAPGRPQAEGPFGVAHLNPATFSNPVLRPELSDFGVTAAPHGSPTSACAATSAAAAAAAEPLIERGGSCLWPAAVLVHNNPFNRATSAPLHAAIASLSSPRAQAATGGSCFAGSPKPSAAAPLARLSPAAPSSSVLPAEAALERGVSTVLPAEPPVRIQVAQPAVLAAAAPPAVGSGSCRSPTAAQPGSPCKTFKSPPSRPLGVQRPRRSSAVAAAVKTAAMMAAEADAEPSEPPQSPAAAGTVAEAKQRPQTAAPSPAARQLAASGSGELADKDHPMHGMHIVVPQYREGESRAEKLERYRAKKLRRKFQPTVRYQCRKHYADARPRVKGRFVSPDEFAAWQESQAAKSAC